MENGELKKLNKKILLKIIGIIACIIIISFIILIIVVISNHAGCMPELDIETQEIQEFNTRFTPYIGVHVSSERVNLLMQKIEESNNRQLEQNTNYYVSIEIDDSLKNYVSKTDVIMANETNVKNIEYPIFSSRTTYKVNIKYNEITGRTESIIIEKATDLTE